ncbi:hypothetical protein HR080_04595 [Staphylococcus schleiferi subsp. coagulans]|uniref:hypothetical protein n=1 Tax=Staphylococcus coagulans TaxID=74706 RepID=UPI0015FE0C2B|nr:hypothetical protein [Staphylococcus coagulans]MBA8778635.1 hypothetical protein [Staphylococcus coagulans]
MNQTLSIHYIINIVLMIALIVINISNIHMLPLTVVITVIFIVNTFLLIRKSNKNTKKKDRL